LPKNKTKKIVPISSNEHVSSAKKLQHSYLISDKIDRDYHIKMRPWQEALDAFFKTIQKKKG